MADVARFDIAIETSSRGVDSTAAELNTLADKIQMTESVATRFDDVVKGASKRLEEAAQAAKLAGDALGSAEKRYRELESAANSAAKQVEKAAASGKDTTQLAGAAALAKAKMDEQAKAVDALRVKSKAADAQHSKMADTLKTLKDKQSGAVSAMQKAKPAAEVAGKSSSIAGAAFAGAAAAAIVLALAVWGAIYSLGAYAVSVNPAATMRLARAQERLQLGMKKLFQGLQLDKFIAGLEDVMTLFDEGNASARGMKTLIETIFQPLFDGAAKAAPYVKEMFKGIIYGALLVVIAVLSIRNAIFKAMSPETRAWVKALVDKVFTLENAFKVGQYAAIALAVGIGLLVAVLAIMWSFIIGIAVAIYKVVAAIANWDATSKWLTETWDGIVDAVGTAIDDLIDYVTGAWDDLVDGAKDAAASMITGIVDGITAGAKWVYDAVKGLGSGAVSKFKSVLGIASPSKVFALQGQYTAQGYVEGIESSKGDVSSALETMVSPSDAGGAPVAGPTSSTSSSTATSSRTIHIAQLTIGDSPVAKQTFDDFRKMLLETLEGASLSIGGGEAPAT